MKTRWSDPYGMIEVTIEEMVSLCITICPANFVVLPVQVGEISV